MDIAAFRSSAAASLLARRSGDLAQLINACRASTNGRVPVDFPDIRETLHDGSVANINLIAECASAENCR
jgi:hypothetical protein